MTTEQQQHADVLDEEQLDELQETPAGLHESDFRGCRWIAGEPAPLRSKMFCGKPTRPGSSWCPEHHRIAFGRTARKRDAA